MSDRSDVWTRIYAGLMTVLGPRERPASEDLVENDNPSPANHSQGSGADMARPKGTSGNRHTPTGGN